jgi:hypothetical protein
VSTCPWQFFNLIGSAFHPEKSWSKVCALKGFAAQTDTPAHGQWCQDHFTALPQEPSLSSSSEEEKRTKETREKKHTEARHAVDRQLQRATFLVNRCVCVMYGRGVGLILGLLLVLQLVWFAQGGEPCSLSGSFVFPCICPSFHPSILSSFCLHPLSCSQMSQRCGRDSRANIEVAGRVACVRGAH